MATLATGTLGFLIAAMLSGGVLACLAAAIMRESFRVNGAPSWVLMFLLAGVPCGLSVPLAHLVQLSDNQPIVLAGMAITLGVPWFHIVLPAVLPDFHPQSFSSSCLMAVLQGIAIYMAGVGMGVFATPW